MQEETLKYDVVIVGAGPSGLATAIHLKQLSKECSICVLEKGTEVGAHILSGAVIETGPLDQLIPDWRKLNAPIETLATKDILYFLTKKRAFKLLTPPSLQNNGNYIVSLGKVCKWLADFAEKIGIDIFPGFPASTLLYKDNKVIGIKTSDKGIDKKGERTTKFQPGIKIFAKQLVLAEGCRGHLTEEVITKFDLRKNAQPQTYALGIKELWEVPKEQHKLGTVIHTIGWPMNYKTYGGSFIYHLENNLISLGFILALDYENPYIDPFKELQRFKTHPLITKMIKNGKRINYGARALNEGGFQSIPKLTFPGGILVGDSAGFLNVPKIKGSHNAILSGITAAIAISETLDNLNDELIAYPKKLQKTALWSELSQARNIRPGFKYGLLPGLANAAIESYILKGKAPWTLKHKVDHLSLKKAKNSKKINYPKPDNIITFDKLSSVYLSGTMHVENQPSHIKLLNQQVAIEINYKQYLSPEIRYCPAKVFEISYNISMEPTLLINAQNCIHCKTCDIKDPKQNIKWVTPEGGGPKYINM